MQIPPAALRRVGVRAILDVVPDPGQVGYPAPLNADARFGYSVVGYLSSQSAFSRCEASRSAIVRLMGQSSNGHTEAKTELAQRAKAGYCPCCATMTHVALPPTFALGSLHV